MKDPAIVDYHQHCAEGTHLWEPFAADLLDGRRVDGRGFLACGQWLICAGGAGALPGLPRLAYAPELPRRPGAVVRLGYTHLDGLLLAGVKAGRRRIWGAVGTARDRAGSGLGWRAAVSWAEAA